MSKIAHETSLRRTFAIISHPDAGKTTITEKLLLYGGAIQLAGTVKGRKAEKMATSDWMALEQQRGISVTTSVMQFSYRDKVVNLLDTPGHEDFSEDTYRTLTAVDSALMVIGGVKGVEPRTIKLMHICSMRKMPIITFVNKFDRECRSPIELLDEIESVLGIHCVPMTWPIGCGKSFKGVYDLRTEKIHLYSTGKGAELQKPEVIDSWDDPRLAEGLDLDAVKEEIELVKGTYTEFDLELMLAGEITPVYFGSALSNFGVQDILDAVVDFSPAPKLATSTTREVLPTEEKFSGFVFKIQANMDPRHRDRIAFLRVCSGKFDKSMKIKHVRLGKQVQFSTVLTFMAGNREHVGEAYAGDIIGLHNHGTIQIGDAFTEGEELQFTGIPYFAPELFQSVRTKEPLKAKALQKGLVQLSEEGTTQVFRPLIGSNTVLGAVGMLQFDVVKHRLKNEYNVECVYESSSIALVRWIDEQNSNKKQLQEFKDKYPNQLAIDGGNALVYLASSRVNLQLMIDRWPEIIFMETRECRV